MGKIVVPMNLPKPKPCPFCGGAALLQRTIGFPEFFVYCLRCDLESPTFDTEKQAVEYWNERFDPNEGV